MRERVHELGGQLSIDTQLGGGTTMSVLLPYDQVPSSLEPVDRLTDTAMTRPSRSDSGTADDGSDVGRSEIRVLIADDHMVVRDGLVAMLGTWTDVTVVAQAENGREAVEQWRQHRPDVTLLDLRMPVLETAPTRSLRVAPVIRRRASFFSPRCESQRRNSDVRTVWIN